MLSEGKNFTHNSRIYDFNYLESEGILFRYIQELCSSNVLTIFCPLKYLGKHSEGILESPEKAFVLLPAQSILNFISLDVNAEQLLRGLHFWLKPEHLSFSHLNNFFGKASIQHDWDNMPEYKAAVWNITLNRMAVTYSHSGMVMCISIYQPIRRNHLMATAYLPRSFVMEVHPKIGDMHE